MYSVYLDESGHETGEHVVVAGYLGSEDQWLSFEEEWKHALGLSRNFHMAKLRWNRDSTRQRLAKLGPIPHRHGLVKVIGAVKVSDYADLLHNMSEAYAAQGYHLCLFPIIVEVLKAVPVNASISWVFEEQHDYEQQTRNVFRNFPSVERERLSNVTFVGKDSTVRTQPADFLSYAMLQKRRDPHSVRARWCEPIFSVTSFLGMIVGHDLIRAILKQSLDAAAGLTTIQSGKNPRVQFASTYESKKEVHEAIARAAAKRNNNS